MLAAAAAVALVACDDGNRNATDAASTAGPRITVAQAEALLQRIVLDERDVGERYTQTVARVHTNEQAAQARADTEFASRQYEAWGQVLGYNVQYDAPAVREILYSGRLARVMNTATIFQDDEGASTQLLYVRALPAERLQDVLTNEGAGTQITDTHVTKDAAFPAKADESFAWRIDGKATFEGGFTVSFIADAVFVRAGNVTGSVTAVALGSAPDRAALERLVDRFVEKARAA